MERNLAREKPLTEVTTRNIKPAMADGHQELLGTANRSAVLPLATFMGASRQSRRAWVPQVSRGRTAGAGAQGGRAWPRSARSRLAGPFEFAINGLPETNVR